MSLSEQLEATLAKTAGDLGALANRIGHLEKNLGYLMKMSIVRTDRDIDGIYRRVSYYRPGGTLFQVSQLEHDPLIDVINGKYNKRVISIYNKQGDAIIDTWSYQLKYDTDGVIVSEQILL